MKIQGPAICCVVLVVIAMVAMVPSAVGSAAASDIQIASAVVCLDVVDRQPLGSGDTFPRETPKLYCFSQIVGAVGETEVIHNWYHQGSLKASVKLTVRSSNWRTWSSKTMAPELDGEWMVEILSADGTPLESIIFFIQ
jgi:hypothetical protein